MTMIAPVVAWTVYAQTTGDNKVSFTLPDPLPDGVRMIAYGTTRSTFADQNKVTLTGWTLRSRQAGGESALTGSNNVTNISPAAVFERISDDDAGAVYTFEIPGGGTTGSRFGVVVLGITGHDPAAAIVIAHAHNSSAGGAGGGGTSEAAAILFPSVTPPADASLLLWLGSNRTNESAQTRTPVEDGLGVELVNEDVNAGLSVVAARGTSGESATGTATWALDTGSARYWSFTVAIAGLEEEEPEPPPPPPPGPSLGLGLRGLGLCAKRPVTLAELRYPQCGLVYGTAPCMAALGVTGEDRCYNTLATCQDRENYDPSETVTLLFSDGSGDVPLAWGAIPSLVRASVKPTRLNIAGLDRNSGQLGLRAAASVTFRDHPDGDRLTDPYVDLRAYDPMKRGTLWPKLIARTAEEWGSVELDILTGDAGANFGDLTRRAYFFETADGPDANDTVVVVGRDILSRADGRKVQAPRPSTGILSLDVTDTAHELWVAAGEDNDDYNQYLPQGGVGHFVRIGSEIIGFQFVAAGTVDGNRRFANLTRGMFGTTPASHQAGVTVQACLYWNGAQSTAILETLLADYAEVPSSWLPVADWQAEEDRWLQPYIELGEVVLSKPEGVAELIGDLCQSIMAYIWTDDRAQKIRFRAVRPPEEQLVEIDDRLHVLPGGQGREVRMEEQVSAARIFYGMINMAGDVEDEANYRRGVIRPGVQIGAPRVRTIFSRWLANASQASLAARTLLGASNGLPVYMELRVGMNRLDAETGGVADLTSRLLQDASGAREQQLFAIVEADGDSTESRLLLRSFGRFAPVCLYMTTGAPDYADATPQERNLGAWFAGADGKLAGQATGYVYS